MKCITPIQAKINEQEMLRWFCRGKSLEARDPSCHGNHKQSGFLMYPGKTPINSSLFPTWVADNLRKIHKHNYGGPNITF